MSGRRHEHDRRGARRRGDVRGRRDRREQASGLQAGRQVGQGRNRQRPVRERRVRPRDGQERERVRRGHRATTASRSSPPRAVSSTSSALSAAGTGSSRGPATSRSLRTGASSWRDYSNDRVQKLSAAADFQLAIAASQPTGVGVDAEGNLYVAEPTGGDRRLRQGGRATHRERPGAGAARGGDVEVSADGTIYVADTGGTQGHAVTRATGKAMGIAPRQASAIRSGSPSISTATCGSETSRRGGSPKFSPSGKMLGDRRVARPDRPGHRGRARRETSTRSTAAAGRSIRFAEDKSKPGTANIPGTITVAGGTAKIAYTLSGVACPAEVGATATLTGSGIVGQGRRLEAQGRREEHDPDEALEGGERQGHVQDRAQDERAADDRDAERDGEREVGDSSAEGRRLQEDAPRRTDPPVLRGASGCPAAIARMRARCT